MSNIESFFSGQNGIGKLGDTREQYLERLLLENSISQEQHDWAISHPTKKVYPILAAGKDIASSTKVWLRDGTTDYHIVKQLFVYDEYSLKNVKNWNPNPKVVVDIGAHIGIFARKIKNVFPSSTVYSFEPLEENFEMLKKNTEELDNVFIENCAIGGSRYASGFKYCGKHGLNNSGGTHVLWSDSKEDSNMPQLSLSEIFQKYDFDTIDILKLDCEGSEYEILPAAYEAGLLDRVRYLVFEYHVSPDKGRHFYEIFKYLDAFSEISIRNDHRGSGIIRCLQGTKKD
jgi:FkbM family methyltransferase